MAASGQVETAGSHKGPGLGFPARTTGHQLGLDRGEGVQETAVTVAPCNPKGEGDR